MLLNHVQQLENAMADAEKAADKMGRDDYRRCAATDCVIQRVLKLSTALYEVSESSESLIKNAADCGVAAHSRSPDANKLLDALVKRGVDVHTVLVSRQNEETSVEQVVDDMLRQLGAVARGMERRQEVLCKLKEDQVPWIKRIDKRYDLLLPKSGLYVQGGTCTTTKRLVVRRGTPDALCKPSKKLQASFRKALQQRTDQSRPLPYGSSPEQAVEVASAAL
eukprot:1232182-Prymnesium_polylepis.1